MPVKIRTTHPWGFRSGEWATLLTITQVNNRCCYVVIFPDGVTDSWVISDVMAHYEFERGG